MLRHIGRQPRQSDGFTRYSQLPQDILLRWRKALDLRFQEAADAAEDRAVGDQSFREKCSYVAGVDLANGFADDLQCQTISVVALNQVEPGMRVSIELFVGEQCLCLCQTQSVELQGSSS